MGQSSIAKRIVEKMLKKTAQACPKITPTVIVAPTMPTQPAKRAGPRCESVHCGSSYRRKGVKIALNRLCHEYSD